MWQMVLPIAMVIISNCFYNIVSKKTPSEANAFLTLAVTYSVAAVISFVVFAIGYHNSSFTAEMKKLNWTSLALGVIIIGLELGYILAYRAGWNVNRAPLVANCGLAIALVFIGLFVFGEHITLRQILGMIVCVAGLIIVTV